MNETIVLDGATGEGGGQILRTGMALSAIIGVPVEIFNIRAGRSKPGLAAQHLTGVRAVAEACGGHLEGDQIGSGRVALTPGRICSSDYQFDVAAERPSAGAVTLVLQALLPVLAFADGTSRVRLKGGTHVEWSPSFHYLDQVLRPALAAVGVGFRVKLRNWGWYPRGGGEVEVEICPVDQLATVDWTTRGTLRSITGVSVVSDLPSHIAQRQAHAARDLLGGALPKVPVDIEERTIEDSGQGTLCFLLAEYGGGGDGKLRPAAAGFSVLGRRGKSAEAVGREAAAALLSHHHSGAALDDHLSDQVLPFLALASGSSRYTAPRVSGHLRTNALVCERLLDIRVGLHEDLPCTVEVHGTGSRR